MDLPIYKIYPSNIENNYFEIAILDDPAIEEFALLFNKDIQQKFTIDEEKQIMVGPALIPNKLIYRDDIIGQRYVTFDEIAIEESAKLFLKKGFVFNFEHSNKKIDVDLIESYFAKENNEFNVPVGSWIVKIHINDKEFWNEIKNKKMGFSIESIFTNILLKDVKIKNKIMNVKEKLIEFINTSLFAEMPEPVIEPEVKAVVEPEVKAVVEEVVEDVIKEEIVKDIVDEAVVEKDYITKEEVSKLFDEMLVKVGEMIKENSPVEQIEELKNKVEEFGKQPLSKPIVEDIETVLTSTDDKYSFLKNIKK